MAALGEIPFGRYYGSVDATPLFVLLAGAYYGATGDLGFVRTIWPNIVAALEWIDRHGDRDGDGFVEYARRSSHGLTAQGWKDSHDSVFHEDGELAEGPVALCEVQGYVYAARRHAAVLAEALGEPGRAEALRRKAEDLRRRFEEAFWCEDLSLYALALDGRKRPCRVRTSNAGQVLFTGIAAPDRARRMAEVLMDESFFSGWGIRTVAASEARYNPMSYHNGSVWPHDNGLVARGFARYGIAAKGIQRILMGLADASTYSHLHRLPELFCGFRRRSGEGPTLYPVACSPQAWSAGSVFMLLEACLGLSVDARRAEVRLVRPALPEILPSVTLRNLRVGPASLDLHFHRRARDVEVDVLSRRGDVEIVIVK
jgi:glycogen debranching enzyme